MAAKQSKLGVWLKMLATGAVVCVGGPALVLWVQPTDEELFKRYSPELQKKSLERRFERQQEFDDFVNQLKDFSKDDRPIWTVQQEAARAYKQERLAEDARTAEDAKARKEAMRKESGLSS